MKQEIWKDIKGYEGLYKISSNGLVKRCSRHSIDSLGRNVYYPEKILINKISKQTGYPCVNLSKDGIVKTHNIHVLIADAFIPNPKKLPCINHKDENRSNSVLSNLERCDYSYNNSYGNAVIKRNTTRRKNMKHKIIYQYDKKGNLINKYSCGVQQLEEKLGYLIGTCLRGKSKTAHGYIFSYNKDFVYLEDLPKKHQKYVLKIDDNGNVIERYKSLSEAAKQNNFDRHLFLSEPNSDGSVIINKVRYIVEKNNSFD